MATKNITGLQNGSIVVSSSGNTYNVDENAKVIATGGDVGSSSDPSGAIMEDSTAMPLPKNNVYNIDGRVIGFQFALLTAGNNDEIHIGETGKISGLYGLGMSGNNSVAVNDGLIESTVGIGMLAQQGDKIHFTNNGDIFGLAGVAAMDADKVQIVNGVHGNIVALQYGVEIDSNSGDTGKFVNHGSVTVTVSMGVAFGGGSGDDTVINDGQFNGHVVLEDGNDTVDDRGGTIHGSIVGGLGDDTLITGKASDKLFENTGEGDDTVKSTVSYRLSDNVENLFLLGKNDINGTGTAVGDKLHGNNGDNTLTGLQGDDELWGGKGNDHLAGGAGADTFHFVTGDAHDVIVHFDQGSDLIDVSQWTGIDNMEDVLVNASDRAGGGVKIESGNDSLVIANLHKADLTDADFVFPV